MKNKDEHEWLVKQIDGDELTPSQVLDVMMTQLLRDVGAKKKEVEPVNCYALIISTFTDDGITDCTRCVSDHFPTIDEMKTYLVRCLLQGKPPADSGKWWNPDNSIEGGDLREFGSYSCEIKGPFASYALSMFTEDLGFERWPLTWQQIFCTMSEDRLANMIAEADEEFQ